MLALLLAPASLVPTGRPAVTTSSRRAALADFGAAAAALAVVPLAANAKSIEEIAAEANAKALKEREEALYGPPPEPEVSAGDKLKPILLIAGGGTALSIPFYFQNVKRLGTKIASGGKDDGRSKKIVSQNKKGGLGKAAKAAFLGK